MSYDYTWVLGAVLILAAAVTFASAHIRTNRKR